MSWFKTVFPIAAIFAFRMLGLFMLIPVFTSHAFELEGSTPTLIGVALGAYGLTQGILQMPFGILSDRWGRKPIITLGLILFATGSALGAQTHSITGMITARILQGSGAIGSVLIALLSDLTSEKVRTSAMAVLGITIGISFGLAMIISPIITDYYGLSGIFYLTAILALIALLLLYTVIPAPNYEYYHGESEADFSLITTVFKNWHLQRLNISIFCQHCLFTASFFVIPLILKQQIALHNLNQPWEFYLPIMLVSFFIMLFLVNFAEKKSYNQTFFVAMIVLIFFSQLALIFTNEWWITFCIFMFFYLVAFNFLEATLPSLISKKAKRQVKGTALGVYSSAQFLGIFVGGILAGLLFNLNGNSAIFIGNSIIALVWFFVVIA